MTAFAMRYSDHERLVEGPRGLENREPFFAFYSFNARGGSAAPAALRVLSFDRRGEVRHMKNAEREAVTPEVPTP